MAEYVKDNVHIMGEFGHVMYLIENHAKRLFSQFELKPWQAGIVLVLARHDMS